MKLYSTITSERATKGQGGNDFLDIELKAFDRDNPIGHITIKVLDDANGKLNQYLVLWYPDGISDESEGYTDPIILKEGHKEGGVIQVLREKGEKQKGEHIHEWGDADEQGTKACRTCTASIDDDGGIIQ